MAVELPPSVVAKVLLLNTMIETNTHPADLARKLGVSRQEVSRLMDLRHTTKIDTVARALYALGRRLDLSLSAS